MFFFFNFKIGRTYGSNIMACFNSTHVLSNKEGSFKETYMLQIIETPYRVYLLPYYTASPIIKTRAKVFIIK